MHHISAEAGISVGLIYRYFENKEAVIAAMAEAYKTFVLGIMADARKAPSLVEAIELVFSAPCDDPPEIEAALHLDLFAEASRNPQVAAIVRNVTEGIHRAFIDLIESAPEAAPLLERFTPREISELICSIHKGFAVNEIIYPLEGTAQEKIERQLRLVRNLCALLFPDASSSAPRTLHPTETNQASPK